MFGLGKDKKGSAALNRAILGPPLPYPTVCFLTKGERKRLQAWSENSIVATTICDRNHCIGPYHRLCSQMLPQKSFQEKKKVGDKKGRLPFVLFFFIQRGKERSSDLSCHSPSKSPSIRLRTRRTKRWDS